MKNLCGHTRCRLGVLDSVSRLRLGSRALGEPAGRAYLDTFEESTPAISKSAGTQSHCSVIRASCTARTSGRLQRMQEAQAGATPVVTMPGLRLCTKTLLSFCSLSSALMLFWNCASPRFVLPYAAKRGVAPPSAPAPVRVQHKPDEQSEGANQHEAMGNDSVGRKLASEQLIPSIRKIWPPVGCSRITWIACDTAQHLVCCLRAHAALALRSSSQCTDLPYSQCRAPLDNKASCPACLFPRC